MNQLEYAKTMLDNEFKFHRKKFELVMKIAQLRETISHL